MKINARFTVRKEYLFCPLYPRVWHALLWTDESNALQGYKPYTTDKVKVAEVVVNNIPLNEEVSLNDLRNSATAYGSFFIEERHLYARFRHPEEPYIQYESAQEWLFYGIIVGVNLYLTNGNFHVTDEQPYHYAIVSNYKLKTSVDLHNYSKLKTNTNNVTFIINEHTKLIDDTIIGQRMRIEKDDGNILQTAFVADYERTFETGTLKVQDQRSRFTDMVVDQHYVASDYRNPIDNNIAMDKDTAKEYKKEVIGYCSNVPCDCLNGYAFDKESYRRYRAGYGQIAVDYVYDGGQPQNNRGVEIEMGDDAWKVLEYGYWWYENILETLPSGDQISTSLICISNYTAHPPQSGNTQPDLLSTPKKLRVTGTFHAEIADITTVYEVLRYLINRYAVYKFSAAYYNLTEIYQELSLINDPMGIFIKEPKELIAVIAELQGGCKYGWDFYEKDGYLTARVNYPLRAPFPVPIKAADILNINRVKFSADASAFVTKLVVHYNRNWDSGNALEITDYRAESKAKSLHSVSKSDKPVDTLLRDEYAAKIRFNEDMKDSIEICPSVTGIELSGLQWFSFLQYDIVPADIAIPEWEGNSEIKLSPNDLWIVTDLEKDLEKEMVTVGLKKKAAQ